MQPPPPPLNLAQLRMLISEADLIAVGKIGKVKKTEGIEEGETRETVEAALSVEKLLKGKVAGKTIVIKETYKTYDSQLPGLGSKAEGEPKKMIVSLRAGPSCYHGRYRQGMRIVVLLEKIEGADEYRPLGSGTYDKHLCEFLIEDNDIKTFYFKFADDVGKYAGCEEQFTDFIRKSATTSRTGGLRRAPERGHRSIRNQTPSVVYQLFPGHECILELFSRPSLLY